MAGRESLDPMRLKGGTINDCDKNDVLMMSNIAIIALASARGYNEDRHLNRHF